MRLIRLQTKTDRQLTDYVNRKLDVGLTAVRAYPNGVSARELHANAEKAYAEARTLLPLIYRLTQQERDRLERKLSELGDLLADTTVASVLRVHVASV